MVSLILAQQQRSKGVSASPGGSEWTHQQINDTIIGSVLSNIDTYWPPLQSAMATLGNATQKLHKVATLATVGVEVPVFAPINEYGDDSYFWFMYDITSPDPQRREVARMLGNVNPGDGVRYHGRGMIQLTGRNNYHNYGLRIGVDLEGNPELALDADVSSAVFVLYFNDRGLWNQALAQNWLAVRQGVNGGYNGLQRFMQYVMAFTYMNDIEDWRTNLLSIGGSRYGDPYVWDGEEPGGFDCSGYVKYLYGTQGRPLTSYTDTAFGETIAESEDEAIPGDVVFYEYHDPSQPDTRFPHMGLWLDQNRTLDSRGGVGVGIHPHVNGAIRHVRRYPG